MAPDTRDRMIDAALVALQRHGVAGMSFTEILAASGAARGAIYHHFPGGKTQLVTEAAARNGAYVRAALAALPAQSAREVADAFLTAVRPVAETAAGGCGCAISAISQDTALRQQATETFASWIDALAGRLAAAGLPADEAQELASTLIALLEGALVLCRAAGDLEPFERITRTVTALIECRY